MKDYRNDREFSLYEAEYRVRHNEPRYRPVKPVRHTLSVPLPWLIVVGASVGFFGSKLVSFIFGG